MKRNVVLYIAMSLDGYIADANGNVDWLEKIAGTELGDFGYDDLMERCDTILMGYTTYHQIKYEISKDHWPYEKQMTYVVTHRDEQDEEGIHFVNGLMKEVLYEVKQKPGKDIWLCGGANVIAQCIKEEEIDEYIVTIMPVLLGEGIRLFDEMPTSHLLHLREVKNVNGCMLCTYERSDKKLG